MYIKAFVLMGLSGALLLAGCSSGGSKYHKHAHKHQYMTKDSQYRTYQYPYNRYYYRGHYYPRHSYQRQYHHSHHYRYYHRMSYEESSKARASYVHHKAPQYPNTYYGNKFGAHTRMSTADNYGQGYAAGCRTAHTGMMYKNPKLLADSQHYQMGWETGFNQCHYDRAHVNGEKDKYSYIPY